MMRSLEEVTTAQDGAIEVDDTWLQGRGAFGGLTIATLVRAIEARVADPRRRVRSVTAELPAPTVPGRATIDVDILRSGANLTVARAALRQGDTTTSHAVAVLAAVRDSVGDLGWRDLAMPDVPAWDALPEIPFASPPFPVFAQHFDYRIASGFPGSRQASVTTGMVRARRPGARRDAAYVAAMIDVWYPAFLVRVDRMRPIATIAYSLELVDGVDGLPADEPLVYRGTVPVCRDGYFVETRELWGSDGRLVALNHQTFAIIQ